MPDVTPAAATKWMCRAGRTWTACRPNGSRGLMTSDTRWKVPGVLDWSTGIYNPRVDITKDSTTLYASDRDVFLFLVDDLNPIEAGVLPDGSPDLYFRGFYCWNSEVGAKTLGIASFYLRAVCQNRNLWGVEDFQEIKIRHSKYAASRFAHQAAPALTRFAESSPAPFAAAFFVSASVVKQRLKLAAVAPSLHEAYAEDEMTLDQLMAFTVNPEHQRQEQVWEALQRHYSKQPYEIRRMLTEGAVRASDKRAQFVGLDNYVEGGGDILRDLFQQDDGGWLQDASLLDAMVTEKLADEAEVIRAEGWKWVEVDTDFPYGHTFGMRRIHGEAEPMSDAEAADYQALKANTMRSRRNMPKRMSCPRRSTHVSERSKQKWKRCRTARSGSRRKTWPWQGPSSASTAPGGFAWSAAMCGRRTNRSRNWRRPVTRMLKLRSPRMRTTPSRPQPKTRRKNTASCRFLTALSWN